MKRFGNPLLSLAAPFLILVATLGLIQRQGNNRLQMVPALVVGAGLIMSGALGRSSRRQRLLLAIRKTSKQDK